MPLPPLEGAAFLIPEVVIVCFAPLTPTVKEGDLTPTLHQGKERLAPPEEAFASTDVPAAGPKTIFGTGTAKVWPNKVMLGAEPKEAPNHPALVFSLHTKKAAANVNIVIVLFISVTFITQSFYAPEIKKSKNF